MRLPVDVAKLSAGLLLALFLAGTLVQALRVQTDTSQCYGVSRLKVSQSMHLCLTVEISFAEMQGAWQSMSGFSSLPVAA